MRLIDADKLRHELIMGHDLIWLPTVKAIPVEWLENYEKEKGQEVRLQEALSDWEKENESTRSDI